MLALISDNFLLNPIIVCSSNISSEWNLVLTLNSVIPPSFICVASKRHREQGCASKRGRCARKQVQQQRCAAALFPQNGSVNCSDKSSAYGEDHPCDLADIKGFTADFLTKLYCCSLPRLHCKKYFSSLLLLLPAYFLLLQAFFLLLHACFLLLQAFFLLLQAFFLLLQAFFLLLQAFFLLLQAFFLLLQAFFLLLQAFFLLLHAYFLLLHAYFLLLQAFFLLLHAFFLLLQAFFLLLHAFFLLLQGITATVPILLFILSFYSCELCVWKHNMVNCLNNKKYYQPTWVFQ